MKKLLTVFLVVLFIDLFPQTTTVVQDDIANNATVYYFHQRKVARTLDGILMAAWNDSKETGGQIVYSIYDEAFDIWSPPAAISNAGDRAIQVALASDEEGNIHATWQQRDASSDKYQTFYSKFDGASWSTPVQISVAASVRGEEATIEVASDGTLWVVYNNDGEGNGSEYLFAVKSTDGGSTWSTDADTLSYVGTFGTSIEVGRTALVSGPNGRMVAVWDNSLDGTQARRETFANQFDGTSWQGEVRISDTTTVDRDHNRYCAAAIDTESNIYAFYGLNIVSGADPRLSYLVMSKKGWDDEWSTYYDVVLDSSTNNFRSVSAVVDSNNVIHLAYRRDVLEDTLYALDEIVYTYSMDNGETWSPRIPINRVDYDAGYVSVGNRVRTAYGVDILWRESKDPNLNDQDTTAVVYGFIPYSMIPVVSVSDETKPSSYLLLNNYPNPFNPSTIINYAVPQRDKIRLIIYDALGRVVKNLINQEVEAGSHSLVWNGLNNDKGKVTSGVYFARLITSDAVKTIKMMLIK